MICVFRGLHCLQKSLFLFEIQKPIYFITFLDYLYTKHFRHVHIQ